jgi:CBS domain-containing protein
MKVREVMTEPLLTCTPETSLAVAARQMGEANYGTLPVVDVQARTRAFPPRWSRPQSTST